MTTMDWWVVGGTVAASVAAVYAVRSWLDLQRLSMAGVEQLLHDCEHYGEAFVAFCDGPGKNGGGGFRFLPPDLEKVWPLELHSVRDLVIAIQEADGEAYANDASRGRRLLSACAALRAHNAKTWWKRLWRTPDAPS